MSKLSSILSDAHSAFDFDVVTDHRPAPVIRPAAADPSPHDRTKVAPACEGGGRGIPESTGPDA